MKKNFLLLLVGMIAFAFTANAQYKVTLKVIDATTDQVTVAIGDENENTNIYAWMGEEEAKDPNSLRALNQSLNPGEWWFPFYGPVGSKYVENGNTVWSIELNVAANGSYEWNPGIKSWGWQDVNGNLADFGYTNNPAFSTDANGNVIDGGITEITLTDDMLILSYNEGTMTLVVKAPDGTAAVFVRGLYGNWGTPEAMTYDESSGFWTYDIQGDRIATGKEDQEYKFWCTDDTWATEEGDGAGNQLADNRTLTYVDGDIEYADDILEWLATSGLASVNASDYSITVVPQGVVITGEFSAVKVYASNGMLIDSANVNGEYGKSLTSGLYIIQVDNATQKVLVK